MRNSIMCDADTKVSFRTLKRIVQCQVLECYRPIFQKEVKLIYAYLYLTRLVKSSKYLSIC